MSQTSAVTPAMHEARARPGRGSAYTITGIGRTYGAHFSAADVANMDLSGLSSIDNIGRQHLHFTF